MIDADSNRALVRSAEEPSVAARNLNRIDAICTQPPVEQAARVRPLDPLRNRLFLAFWITGFVSNLGTWMHELAAAFYMTLLEPTPIWVSMVRTAMSLPIFCFALFAGVLADQLDRRKMLIATQIFLSVVTGLLALFTLMDWNSPVGLILFTLALGFGACMHVPTWQSILPEIVPRHQIAAAVALGSLSFNLARCIGPALSGLAIGFFGVAFSFAINACSFLAVLVVLISWNRVTPADDNSERNSNRITLIRPLAYGLRYLLSEPSLRNVYLRVIVYVMPGSIVWALIPLVAKEKYGSEASGLGLLISAFGFGAVCGAAILPRLRRNISSQAIVFFMTLLLAVGFVLIAISRLPILGLLAMAILGLSWMGSLTTFNASLQLNLENQFRARGLSLYLTVVSFSLAFGPLGWGFFASQFGIDAAFLLAAFMSILIFLLTWNLKMLNFEP